MEKLLAIQGCSSSLCQTLSTRAVVQNRFGPAGLKGKKVSPSLACGVSMSTFRKQTCVRSSFTQIRSRGKLVQMCAMESTSEVSTQTMEDIAEFLKEDLTHLFDDIGIDKSAYASNVEFMDPITKYDNIDGYLFNIQMLRRVFAPNFELHSVKQTGPYEVTTRWTMDMKLAVNPFGKWWSPKLLFTGTSIMEVDPVTRKFISHKDTWDSIAPDDQEYLSIGGVKDLVYQVTRLYRPPDVETPPYKVWLRGANYEVREYAGGGGAGRGGAGEGPGGRGLRQLEHLLERGPLTCAALTFDGEASADLADQQAAKLEACLRADGRRFVPGYTLVEYNDPSTPGMFRRNEVILPLTDFTLE